MLAHAYFSVEGLAERMGVRLVTGADRERILKIRWREAPPGPVIVLQARQRFPDSAKVRLVWGAGVAAATGVANDQDQTLQFQVRGPFVVTLRCEREHAQAHCLPITPIRAAFSGPVPWERARGWSWPTRPATASRWRRTSVATFSSTRSCSRARSPSRRR